MRFAFVLFFFFLFFLNQVGSYIDKHSFGSSYINCINWRHDKSDNFLYSIFRSFEPRHEKTSDMHMRKQRRRSASR